MFITQSINSALIHEEERNESYFLEDNQLFNIIFFWQFI